LTGQVDGFVRKRLHVPRQDRDGKSVRYEQPAGTPLRAYFPPASLGQLRDGESPIFVTEGEKKALALSQLGVASVGIGGIWCGCWKDENGQHELIGDLAEIPWTGRVVYIVFDFDE
jgi:hypothetical protein